MDYRTIVEWIKSLSPEEQRSIITELSDTLKEMKNSALDQLLPISNDMLAIEWHTLDTWMMWMLLYKHLKIFKEQLINRHSENTLLIEVLPVLSEKIKKIKLFPWNQNGDWRSTEIVLGGITFLRNEWFTQDVPQVKNIIQEIENLGLSRVDAGRLFVVIAWLPMIGYRPPNKWCYYVGSCACIAYSAMKSDKVDYFFFSYDEVWFSRNFANIAMPSFSASNL